MAKRRAMECRAFIAAMVEKAEAMRVPIAIGTYGISGNSQHTTAGLTDHKL